MLAACAERSSPRAPGLLGSKVRAIPEGERRGGAKNLAMLSHDIAQAYQELPYFLKDTPLIRARTEGLLLKLETVQPTGAYKIRAAWLALSRLGPEAKERGVALSSSGNFAAAFTWAAHRLGIPAHLVLTPTVSGIKVAMAQQYPCTLHRCQTRYEARYELLQELSEQGIITIDHRLDRNVFTGHATIGWECVPSAQQFDRVLIPVSTGGLAIGVARALRAQGYSGEILGIQPSGNPTVYRSWKNGAPLALSQTDTCCDALTATSLPQEAFDLLQENLDDILKVDENSVQRAVKQLLFEEGIVTEPGAAVGMAAILEDQVPAARTLLILSGRNIDEQMLQRCLGYVIN